MKHWLYLVLLLVWVLVLGFQWLIGWKKLWQGRQNWLWIVIGASIYLSLADGVALRQRIWFFHPAFLIGWSIGNVPVEELLFFVLMTAMIVQGFILISPSRMDLQNRPLVREEKGTDLENMKERSREDVYKSRGETQNADQ